MEQTWYLGVDLGGTQLRVAAVAADGSLLTDVTSMATGPLLGPEALVAQLRRQQAQLAATIGTPMAAIGIGVPCVVRPGRPPAGCDNLPRLSDVDLAAVVASATGVAVLVENDARCFVLGETRFGAARGARDVVGLTLGTGVGCGIVLDGRLHRGHHGDAGEACRIPLRGVPVETHVSGAGVVRAYERAGGLAAVRDAATLAEAARAGDRAAESAWRSFGEDLAFLCQCIAALLDPECVVLGGSLARARELFEPSLRAGLGAVPARIAYSGLGGAAGVIGAAALCLP